MVAWLPPYRSSRERASRTVEAKLFQFALAKRILHARRTVLQRMIGRDTRRRGVTMPLPEAGLLRREHPHE